MVAVSQLLNFAPLNDYVLVRPIVANETAGGLALPDSQTTYHDTRKGLVERVGPGRMEMGELIECGVSEGDVVYLAAETEPLEISLNADRFFLIRSRFLVGKTENN